MLSVETYILAAHLTEEAYEAAKVYADEKAELGFNVTIVDDFPEEPDKNTIYLKPSEDLEGRFDEWIYIPSGEPQWNKIGTTGVDFTNYYTKNEVNEKVEKEIEDTNKTINKTIQSVTNLNDYGQSFIFDNEKHTLELTSRLENNSLYVLCYTNGSSQQSLSTMYTNTGTLFALTGSGTNIAQGQESRKTFGSTVSSDRRTINPEDLAYRDNAIWLAESYEGSTTNFTLRNTKTKQYLRNDNGTITYRDNIGTSTVWTLKNIVGEEYIFTALIPTNDTTKYIRISNGNQRFQFGSTSQESDGRNANLYLYKLTPSITDETQQTHEIDLSNETEVSGDSVRSFDEEGNLVITSSGAGQNTVFKPILDVVNRYYSKCTITYSKASGGGTFAYKYHKLGAGTRPQDDYKWGTGSEYRFPSSETVKQITFDTEYMPIDEVVVFDWNSAGSIIIKSVVFYDPQPITVTHEYLSVPVIIDEAATEIKVNTSPTIGNIFVTNNAAANTPTWEEATTAVKNNAKFEFTNIPTSGFGIGVKHITTNEINSLAWAVEPPTIDDATTTEHGLMSASDKTKLNGIASGAEVNQNTFSNIKVGSSTIVANSKTDTLEIAAGSNITLIPDTANDKITIDSINTDTTYDLEASVDNNQPTITLTPSSGSTDHVHIVGSGATTTTRIDSNTITISSTDTTYDTGTASTSGLTKLYTDLGNNEDGAITQKRMNEISNGIITEFIKCVRTTSVGQAGGVASLDANGFVPSSQLPSYVDDVIEGYYDNGHFYDKPFVYGYLYHGSFYRDVEHTVHINPEEGIYYCDIPTDDVYIWDDLEVTIVEVTPTEIVGTTGKIYVDLTTNKTYRWSGSAFVVISETLALGTTSSTAYRGDYGNTAYSHATDANKLTTAQTSGLYKIATTVEGHIASIIPVEKSDITTLGIPAQDTTYSDFVGSGSGAASGLVPSPGIIAGTNKFLCEDGTWQITPDTTYSVATTSTDGLMSAIDKQELAQLRADIDYLAMILGIQLTGGGNA